MSTRERDPIFEALDRLAGIADGDPVGDRMPDIRRRAGMARRRRVAGLVAAAVVLTVGGVGVQQALSEESATPPVVTTPDATPAQRIELDVRPRGSDELSIGFVVSGRSTPYVDPATGDPLGYAGPASAEVLVDGQVAVLEPAAALLRSGVPPARVGEACEPAADIVDYRLEFHVDEPLVVPVTSPGEHTVVVNAPYCADGELVESTETVVVRTGAALQTAERLRVDLDGDGADEVVELLWPGDVDGTGNQVLRVRWGTGETTEASLPNEMESDLPDPVDLDGDGDLELIVGAGGGDMAVYRVFLAEPDSLAEARVVAGGGRGLHSDTDTSAWQTHLGADGFSDYRFADPDVQKLPAEVEVLSWTLAGDTLTLAERSTARCAMLQPDFTFGPC